MATKNGTFPPQKVPLSKKDKEWKENSLEAIIARFFFSDDRRNRMKVNYDMMNSVFDMEDLKYVTDPYKVGEGFPAKMQNINIVRPKIELLKGEETKRPESFLVFRTDEAAVEDAMQQQKDMIYSAMEEAVTSSMETSTEEGMKALQSRLQEIKKYIDSKYYDPAEQTANKTLKYLREKLDIKTEFMKGWEDALVAGEEIYYVGILNGEPVLERVNPLFFGYDRDPDLRNIEQGEWACRHMLMTPTAIHDRFYDLLTEEDLNRVLSFINNQFSSFKATGSELNTKYIMFRNMDGVNPYDTTRNLSDPFRKGPFIRVYHGTWKSFKKIGYLTYSDVNGELQTSIVDETYRKQPGEEIEWDWINEVWEGYRIGDEIYVGIKPIEYQSVSIDNPNAQTLPYFGSPYSNNNTEQKSLVEIMKPLQYIYLILWYRLELTIARDKGKIINMDVTQIPKGMGIDEVKWMHYLTAMGVNFFNPYEEGWLEPGRTGGKPSSFNQFSQVDLTMSNVIAEYINLLSKIEEMVGELSGVSKQRQGSISSNELVGNVERSVIQSSHITEPLFWKHNTIKKNALTALLNTAKFAWRMHDKKKINFILNGPERVYLKITEDFLYADHDIFFSDSTKEHRDVEKLQQLYQPAMQNGASLLDIATIMTSNNMSEIKQKLEQIEQKNMEAAQAQAQLEQEMQQQATQVQADRNRITEEDSIRKSETAIAVAMIQANSQGNDTSESEAEESNEPSPLDLQKLELDKDKVRKDYEIKTRQIKEIERHNKAAEIISNKKKAATTTKS